MRCYRVSWLLLNGHYTPQVGALRPWKACTRRSFNRRSCWTSGPPQRSTVWGQVGIDRPKTDG